MARGDEQFVAALDIGSSKVATLIARVGEDGLRIVGAGQQESRGVKRGTIVDMESAETAVRETLDRAERMSGTTIDDVWAGFAAGGLSSDVATVEMELGGQQVEDGDVRSLLDEGARGSMDREGQVALHAQPALFTIDGVEGVANPRGLHADRLGVTIHVVFASLAPFKNLDYVIRSAHLGVGAIVAAPLASARACLSKDERELGVALVELGADVTTVSLHVGGMLVGLRTIPIGARDISEDIAMAFGVKRRDAERMKCFYGSASQSPSDNQEMIDAQIGEHGEPARIARAQLVSVIRQRLEELSDEIEAALSALGFTGAAKRQVVLTGGGAELKNIDDYLQGVLGHRVRIGRPGRIKGLPEAQGGPGFSALVGLLMLAAQGEERAGRDIALPTRRRRGGRLVDRLMGALRGAS